MSDEIQLSREIADSDMDEKVKEFLRLLILLPSDDVSQKKIESILNQVMDETN